MTTTRYFEVNVTGCNNCLSRNIDMCWHAETGRESYEICKQLYDENRDQLTDSCPMAAQHKTESETK